MAQRVPITIRLNQFEGPLDLLLYLIQSHELDISAVSITTITDQYLEYIRLMEELNFDIASDFLVMAATLLQWKSKAILPKEDEEENRDDLMEEDQKVSPEDLVKQLLEHRRFLEAGEELSSIPKLGEDVFVRPNTKPPVEKIWRDMNITDLALGYQDAITTSRKRKKILKKETVSLSQKINEFRERLEVGKMTELTALFSTRERAEMVVTFLASLELSRLKKLKVYQDGTYEPIFLELIQSLQGFDLGLATGFESETQGGSILPTIPSPQIPQNETVV